MEWATANIRERDQNKGRKRMGHSQRERDGPKLRSDVDGPQLKSNGDRSQKKVTSHRLKEWRPALGHNTCASLFPLTAYKRP